MRPLPSVPPRVSPRGQPLRQHSGRSRTFFLWVRAKDQEVHQEGPCSNDPAHPTNVHHGGSCSQDICNFFSEAELGSLDLVSR